MRQYTTPEQTAKLIELGFDKPKSIISAMAYMEDFVSEPCLDCETAYSIGELIKMLPMNINNDGSFEEKGIFVEIRSDVNEKLGRITSLYNIVYDYDGHSSSVHICCDEYPTYELALEDALKYALENLV